MSNQRTSETDVEAELFLDRVYYGTSYHKIVDGKKVRIDPRDVHVYWSPSRLQRLWWRFKKWLKR